MKTLYLCVVAAATMSTITPLSAEMGGKYVSTANPQCQINVTKLKSLRNLRFTDGPYAIQSRGVAGCTWDALGLAKGKRIAGGFTNQSGDIAYITLNWPSGIDGNKVDMASFDTNGTKRSGESFRRNTEDFDKVE
ncbi:hypothetical protein [Pelagibius sp. Alg239-R121]|uniref:hypothetical protein n=1 Tax=Pelagibius sp. Alg239-R121 TaxID=2993448 RepID=UPI0024A6F1B2|nr:hypothetical protein [Pelagibius sp. Alg239-R121]